MARACGPGPLGEAGGGTVEVDVGGGGSTPPLTEWWNLFRVIQANEVWRAHGAWVSEHRPQFGPGVKQRFEGAGEVTDAEADEASEDAAIGAEEDSAAPDSAIDEAPAVDCATDDECLALGDASAPCEIPRCDLDAGLCVLAPAADARGAAQATHAIAARREAKREGARRAERGARDAANVGMESRGW